MTQSSPATPTTEPTLQATRAATPMLAVLLMVFINSGASGVTFNGISFICDRLFHYELGMNCAMGVMLGLTYVVGALATGPLTRAIARIFKFNTRQILVGLLLTAMLLHVMPLTVWLASNREVNDAVEISVWLFVGLYSMLCGGLWPIVESYMSGGRSPQELPRSIGRFNVTWSSSLVLSMFVLGLIPGRVDEYLHPALTRDDGLMLTLALMGILHGVSIVTLLGFTKFPGKAETQIASQHTSHDLDPRRASYPRLLTIHRAILPMSYAVSYALLPFLPTMTNHLGLSESSGPIFCAIWLFARPIIFLLLDRWTTWHGTKLTAWFGSALIGSGFALCIFCTLISSGTFAIAMAALGLVAFGAGMAMIYVAALYYGLEVGHAEVDAGGTHEALIGAGYTLGPVCGLLAVGAASFGWIAATAVNPVMLGLVTVATVGGTTLLLRPKRAG
jgi:MFS family permease